MKNCFRYLSTFLLGLYFCSLSGCSGKDITTGQNIPSQHGQSSGKVTLQHAVNLAEMPLYFITNEGQVNEQARFYAKTPQYTLWLTREGLVFDSQKHIKGEEEPKKIHRDVSKLVFVNANPKPEIVPVDEAALKVNYFVGNDRSKWRSGVQTSQAVLYKDVYQDINVKVFGKESEVEYDWIVNPGADPGIINFAYEMVRESRIDKDGNLLLTTQTGEFIHKRPIAYQEIDDKRVLVTADYKQLGKNEYGFVVDNYDVNYPLVIDPVVLVYSTYLGGTTDDKGYAIDTDSNGNVYITGETISTNFPTTDQYQAVQAGIDIFVTKINTNDSDDVSVIYSTYLGGSFNETGFGIAADDSGNIYVTGTTYSSDFPLVNQYQSCGNDGDAFVTRIDTTQSGVQGLIYSTCLNGVDDDNGYAIAADDSGNAFVTGATDGDFPIKNQYQNCDNGGVFVTRIDTTRSGASSLIYSTCLGGSNFYEQGYGIAADNSGNAYVTGVTESSDFPTLNQLQLYRGNRDAFVSKIDTTKTGTASLIYSTFLGGYSVDFANGIAIDGNGGVYVTGNTESSDFPTMNEYQNNLNPIGADAFVTKLNITETGTASLVYSTFLGGMNYDSGQGIAVDESDNAYVTGWTSLSLIDFPTKYPYQTNQYGEDAFVSKINTEKSGTASLIYSTYLGGNGNDRGQGIAVDKSGDVYVTGLTSSIDFPTNNEYQSYQGGSDAFVVKLSGPLAELSLLVTGNGKVTSSPAGIDCPGDCSEGFDKDSKITLTAVPSLGASFGSWTGGGCGSSATCTVTMDKDIEITATFGKKDGAVSSWLKLLLGEEI